jgi:DNA repair protein RadC
MEKTHQERLLEVSEIQLTYKGKIKPSLRPKIECSRDAFNILKKHWNENTIELVEEFKILLLSRANKVIGLFKVSNGSSTGTVVDPKLIFVAALKANACGIILSHNHPSGNLTPSTPDMPLSKKIKDGAKLLELSVLDHIIVTSDDYYSFADEGLL